MDEINISFSLSFP